MKKLIIIFKDKSKITYTMKNSINHIEYFKRHSKSSMVSAVFQQYPKKNNEPVDLLAQ